MRLHAQASIDTPQLRDKVESILRARLAPDHRACQAFCAGQSIEDVAASIDEIDIVDEIIRACRQT